MKTINNNNKQALTTILHLDNGQSESSNLIGQL